MSDSVSVYILLWTNNVCIVQYVVLYVWYVYMVYAVFLAGVEYAM